MQSIPTLKEHHSATQTPKLNGLLIGQDLMGLNFKRREHKT